METRRNQKIVMMTTKKINESRNRAGKTCNLKIVKKKKKSDKREGKAL